MSHVLTTTAEPSVTVDRVQNSPVKGGSHKFIWLTVTGLGPDQNTATVSLGQMGMKRITALKPAPLGEPFSVAWDGNAVEPGLVFDGWQDGDTRVLVEAWGL